MLSTVVAVLMTSVHLRCRFNMKSLSLTWRSLAVTLFHTASTAQMDQEDVSLVAASKQMQHNVLYLRFAVATGSLLPQQTCWRQQTTDA